MNRLVAIIVLVVGVVAGLLVAIGLGGPDEPAARTPRAATVLPEPKPLPAFTLVDHRGETQTRTFFQGGWQLVFFGFTNCPDICPTTLATLSTVTKTLRDEGVAEVPSIVLVSVDPDRDTPAKLAEYIAYFGDGNAALTGTETGIRQLTEPLGIYFNKVPLGEDGDEDNYTVDHSSVVLLVNPAAEFEALFSGPIEVADLVRDLPLLTGSS